MLLESTYLGCRIRGSSAITDGDASSLLALLHNVRIDVQTTVEQKFVTIFISFRLHATIPTCQAKGVYWLNNDMIVMYNLLMAGEAICTTEGTCSFCF